MALQLKFSYVSNMDIFQKRLGISLSWKWHFCIINGFWWPKIGTIWLATEDNRIFGWGKSNWMYRIWISVFPNVSKSKWSSLKHTYWGEGGEWGRESRSLTPFVASGEGTICNLLFTNLLLTSWKFVGTISWRPEGNMQRPGETPDCGRSWSRDRGDERWLCV